MKARPETICADRFSIRDRERQVTRGPVLILPLSAYIIHLIQKY